MHKRGSRKGISEVVVVTLIILLSIASIIIVWNVIKIMIKNASSQAETSRLTTNLEINKKNINITDEKLTLRIKRNPGAGNIAGIIFIIENETKSYTEKVYIPLNELEEKTFEISLEGKITNITKISIAPILSTDDGKEIIGPEKDSYIIKNYKISACKENWQCSAWSTCINNQQNRTCTDLNNCKEEKIETQACTSTCTEGETQSCTASNNCTGTQTCTGGAWGTCTTNLQKCEDGSCQITCPQTVTRTIKLTAGNITQDASVLSSGIKFTTSVSLLAGFDVGNTAVSRVYIDFNTSSIPDGSTINDIDLNISISFVGEQIFCNVKQMEKTGKSQTGANAYADIGNGTAYLSGNNMCTGTGWKNRDLGTSADSNLQNRLTADWFSIGIQAGNEGGTAVAFDSSESAKDSELVVTYNCTLPC